MVDKNDPKVKKALEESAQRIRALIEEGHDKDTVLRINKEQLKKALDK